VKQESFSGNSVEFSQSSFGKTPKVFNAVHMSSSAVGILFGMIDSFVLVAVKNKTVIRCPFVRIDGGVVLGD